MDWCAGEACEAAQHEATKLERIPVSKYKKKVQGIRMQILKEPSGFVYQAMSHMLLVLGNYFEQ